MAWLAGSRIGRWMRTGGPANAPADPSQPSWGLMIDDAKNELARPYWGNLVAATLFMFGLILSFNLFNDALREALDPKMKNK